MFRSSFHRVSSRPSIAPTCPFSDFTHEKKLVGTKQLHRSKVSNKVPTISSVHPASRIYILSDDKTRHTQRYIAFALQSQTRTPHRRAVTRRWPYKRRIPVNDVRASTLLSHESGLRRSFPRFTTVPNNLSPLVPLDFPCFSLRTTLSNLVSTASSRFHRSRYAGTRAEQRLPTVPQILQSI